MVCATHGQACCLLGVGQDESRRLCTLRQQRVDGDGALTELSAEHQHLGTLGLELLQGVQTAGQACALGRDRDQHAAVLHGLLIGRGTHHTQRCIGDGLLCGAARFGVEPSLGVVSVSEGFSSGFSAGSSPGFGAT